MLSEPRIRRFPHNPGKHVAGILYPRGKGMSTMLHQGNRILIGMSLSGARLVRLARYGVSKSVDSDSKGRTQRQIEGSELLFSARNMPIRALHSCFQSVWHLDAIALDVACSISARTPSPTQSRPSHRRHPGSPLESSSKSPPFWRRTRYK